ncbi:MAG: antitoxin Xre/MbcA/ParS toxin-binding domain-containing protein [Candidatus Nanopelagicaceae bacterium]|jgi:putative toxin-antitoxin system antitoxin component (TIGR02293 family)
MVNAISTSQMLGGIDVLGIEVQSDRDLEKIVLSGLPTNVVTKIIEKIYPGQTDKVYQLVPRSTLIRRQKAGSILNVEESQKAERMARVFSFAVEVWNSEDKAREFMTKPHPMLEDRTPFEASLGELGARQVEEILGRLMFGICA